MDDPLPVKDNPDVDKQIPKVILKAQWILHPKYEHVPRKDNHIKEQQHRRYNDVPQYQVNVAKELGKWAIKMHAQIWNLNYEKPG